MADVDGSEINSSSIKSSDAGLEGNNTEAEKDSKMPVNDGNEDQQTSEKKETKGESLKEKDSNDSSEQENYEIKDGKYYYSDSQSGQRYKFDDEKGQWVTCDEYQDVTTDEEGRTYYKAQGMQLCRDPHGNVFYLDKNNEWLPWGSQGDSTHDGKNSNEKNKWYFHQGNDMFYRDRLSNTVYKLNKDKNDWEVYEGKIKVKRPRLDTEEEFDTDEDESDEGEDVDCTGSAPPGARNDPSIEYDGFLYTKRDPGDNMVYEWDSTRRAWFPKIDEDFMANYQMSYGFNPDGTKDENPLKFDDEPEEEEEEIKTEEEKKGKGNQQKAKPTWFEMDAALNTKVYVSNLPCSTTEEEFLDIMQKCGMILKDPETNKFKIKMYHDSEGNFKGDALCTYIKRESVDLALQILDEYQVGHQRIRVELAKFQLKGEYNPKLKPKKKRRKDLEKLQKKQEKLFDWRPEPMRGQRQKHERTVIIRNVFDPKDFENNVEKILTHKEAMRNQCLNFGQINKLEIHDLHSEGVVQVTFAEVEAADMCVATLNERLYLKRSLKVATWDGKEKFRIEETEAQREERLKKWDKFLEGESSETQ